MKHTRYVSLFLWRNITHNNSFFFLRMKILVFLYLFIALSVAADPPRCMSSSGSAVNWWMGMQVAGTATYYYYDASLNAVDSPTVCGHHINPIFMNVVVGEE